MQALLGKKKKEKSGNQRKQGREGELEDHLVCPPGQLRDKLRRSASARCLLSVFLKTPGTVSTLGQFASDSRKFNYCWQFKRWGWTPPKRFACTKQELIWGSVVVQEVSLENHSSPFWPCISWIEMTPVNFLVDRRGEVSSPFSNPSCCKCGDWIWGLIRCEPGLHKPEGCLALVPQVPKVFTQSEGLDLAGPAPTPRPDVLPRCLSHRGRLVLLFFWTISLVSDWEFSQMFLKCKSVLSAFSQIRAKYKMLGLTGQLWVFVFHLIAARSIKGVGFV